MKGMLLKELYNLKQTARIYVLLTVFWLVMGIVQRDSAYLSGLVAMVMVLIPNNAIAYDEASKWERYALTMPVLRRDLVAARYVLMLLCGAVMTAASCLTSLLIGETLANALTISLGVLAIGTVLGSILLPVMTRFGVQKGRVVIMLMALLPSLLIICLRDSEIRLPAAPSVPPMFVALGALIAALILTFVSFLITNAIYEKKEF